MPKLIPSVYDVRVGLKDCRELRGFTQAELGAKCGLHPTAISAFESGRRSPSLKNLVKLADVLDVSLDVLIERRRPNA